MPGIVTLQDRILKGEHCKEATENLNEYMYR